jgi:hypothetical protein
MDLSGACGERDMLNGRTSCRGYGAWLGPALRFVYSIGDARTRCVGDVEATRVVKSQSSVRESFDSLRAIELGGYGVECALGAGQHDLGLRRRGTTERTRQIRLAIVVEGQRAHQARDTGTRGREHGLVAKRLGALGARENETSRGRLCDAVVDA